MFSVAIQDETQQDCEDLLQVSPPQSLKIQSYIRHLETEGISRVKMFIVITTAYLIFWGPLFLVTLVNYTSDWKQAKNSMGHEVSLHICFVHAFVNPLLFLVLHKDLRATAMDMLCCTITNNDRRQITPPSSLVSPTSDAASPSSLDQSKKYGGILTNSKQETLIM